MSETMSSVEIEDVLSSIRRLVSDDLRPVARGAQRPMAASKLILTPALRVVAGAAESGAAPQPAAATAIETPGPAKNAAQDREFPIIDLPTLVLEVPVPSTTATSGLTSEAADPAAATGAGASIEAVVAAVGAGVSRQAWDDDSEDRSEIEADWKDLAWPDPTDASAPSDAAVEEAEVVASSSPAQILVAIGWQTDDPAATEADEADDDAPTMGIFVSTRDGGSRAAAVDPGEKASADLPPVSDQCRVQDDLAEAAAVAAILDDTPPQPASAAAPGGAPDDQADARIGAQAGAQVGDRIGVFDPEDAVLDEEILRDLVRDIIREELQGGLGERITRNVRKLVRSEINRVLAGHEFE